MTYVPTTWVDGSTKLGPTNLNHLELGLQAAAAVADSASVLAAAALPTPAGSNGQFLKRVGGIWVPTSFAASDIPSYPTDATKALLGDGSWAQIANAQIAAAAAIAASKLADPTTGKVLGSSGGACAAVFPPGYQFDYAEVTSTVNVTGTSSAAATTVVTGNAVTYDGTTKIQLAFYCPRATKGTTFTTFILYDGSTELGQFGSSIDASPAAPVYVERQLTPSNASHTYTVKAFVDAGTGAADGGTGVSGAKMPIFLRITKV